MRDALPRCRNVLKSVFLVHFNNEHIAACEEASSEVLDGYHARNNIDGESGNFKKHYSLGSAMNVVGERAVTRHVLWTMIASQVVAMVWLQHGSKEDLFS